MAVSPAWESRSAMVGACKVRPVARWAKLGPTLESLPPVLADCVGRTSDLPNRAALGALLAELHLDGHLAEGLLDPLSRANDNDPLAPKAKYLVIHDSSGPKLRSWPANLDEDRKINNLNRFIARFPSRSPTSSSIAAATCSWAMISACPGAPPSSSAR